MDNQKDNQEVKKTEQAEKTEKPIIKRVTSMPKKQKIIISLIIGISILLVITASLAIFLTKDKKEKLESPDKEVAKVYQEIKQIKPDIYDGFEINKTEKEIAVFDKKIKQLKDADRFDDAFVVFLKKIERLNTINAPGKAVKELQSYNTKRLSKSQKKQFYLILIKSSDWANLPEIKQKAEAKLNKLNNEK